MKQLLQQVNQLVWGAPALVMILGVGIWLSLRTRFGQLRLLKAAFWELLDKLRPKGREEAGVSPYQTLCTALAATVGTGNIAGVAGAIAIGGPGAIFWMWVCGIFGMMLKFAEACLAVRFQRQDANGQPVGGVMYIIEDGLGKRWKWLGCLYCFFGIVAAFGVGNATQMSATLDGLAGALDALGLPFGNGVRFLLGIVLACVIAFMLLGGAKRVGEVAQALVPVAAIGYVFFGLLVLVLCHERIPAAFALILKGAFSPSAVTGGMLGSALCALRVGVSRGVFTNEAGMGTAAIAYASAKVSHPVKQGLMGIMEVFLDTIVICTVTALVILCSGACIPYGTDEGAVLTARAFSRVLGSWFHIPLALFLSCFAFATMLGWGMYGVGCARSLFGDRAWKGFVLLQAGAAIVSCTLKTGTVWLLAEAVNGLMVIPNLIAVAALSPLVVRLYTDYQCGRNSADGGTYESFDQCKPLRAFSHEKVPSSGRGSRASGQEDLSPEYRSA